MKGERPQSKAKDVRVVGNQETLSVSPVETKKNLREGRRRRSRCRSLETKSMHTCRLQRSLGCILLVLGASLVLLFCDTKSLPCAEAFAPWSSIAAHPGKSSGFVITIGTPRTQLQVSSIRTWFSLVSNKTKKEQLTTGEEPSSSYSEQKNSKQGTGPIFFKRDSKNNNSNNKTQSPLQEDHELSASDGSKTGTAPTTWVNLLGGDNNTTRSTSTTTTPAPLSENISPSLSYGTTRRQAVQHGIFAPNSSLRHFPEYTSAWANTLSSTLHNTTSNAWNKVAHAPLGPTFHDDDDDDNSDNNNVSGDPSTLAIPSYLQPTDTLTVADLQAILQRSGYYYDPSSSTTTPPAPQVRAQDFASSSQNKGRTFSRTSKRTSSLQQDTALVVPPPTVTASSSSNKPRKTKQGVAFPQVSILDYKSLQRGTALTSAFMGMLVATTLLPNLWMMGLIAGAVYGHDICSRPDQPPPSNLLARTLIGWGGRLAQFTLQTIDSCRTLWFLYKTGELSYQYYKRYEAMDQRFSIQSKMDAWNAKFQEGKIKFDQWEQDNEIGRTVLAGLRTMWLVDERAKRRAKQKSRYRLVQSLYDSKYWMGRWTRKTWKALLASRWTDSVRDYVKGVQTDLWNGGQGSIPARLGAVVASLIALNIVGALFVISPTFLALLAIGVGVAWPSWVAELASRLDTLTLETRARGRGEDIMSSTDSSAIQQLLMSSNSRTNTARLLGRYDKSKYDFFKREDGTKRYYRTGQSLFVGRRDKDKKSSNINNNKSSTKPAPVTFSWPWAQPQRVRRTPEKEQWGVFLSKPRK
jgi:hypothetical protein